MSIKICDKNKLKIEDQLKAVQSSSKVNLYSYERLLDLSVKIEAYLDAELSIPKKYRLGVEVIAHDSGPWANAYSYGQGATEVKIVRKSTGWYFKEAMRIKVYPKASEKREIIVSQAQLDIAIEKLKALVTVKVNPVSLATD